MDDFNALLSGSAGLSIILFIAAFTAVAIAAGAFSAHSDDGLTGTLMPTAICATAAVIVVALASMVASGARILDGQGSIGMGATTIVSAIAALIVLAGHLIGYVVTSLIKSRVSRPEDLPADF